MSKSGYHRSILEVSVNIDRQKEREFKKRIHLELPRLALARQKTPGLSASTGLSVERSDLSQQLEQDLTEREKDLRTFKQQTMNAQNSPLLTQALVKKTADRLEQVEAEIEIRETNEKKEGIVKQNSFHFDKFKRAAKIIILLSSLCYRWKRYDALLLKKLGVDQKEGSKSPSRKGRKSQDGIGGFNTGSFHTERSKVPEEVIDAMQTIPRKRSDDDLKKIQAFCKKVRAFQTFPVEKEPSLSGWVGYAKYDRGRVISMQGRRTDRWYFVLAGRISKVQTMELTAGVKKQFFADLIQGNCTDVDEVIQGDNREYSLLCHTTVEVLLLEREDIEEVFASTSGQGTSILSFLRSIDLFSTYPLDELYAERDALTIKYYAKDTIIGDSDTDSKYLYILKSGTGTLHVKSNSSHRKERLEELNIIPNDGTTQSIEQAVDEDSMHSSVFDKRDMYGFDTILERALKKVQNGIGANYFEDVVLPDPTHSKLVSDGAECVLISKIIFLKISDFCTLCKLITTHLNKEPQQNQATKKNENTAGWNKFKEEIVQEVINRR